MYWVQLGGENGTGRYRFRGGQKGLKQIGLPGWVGMCALVNYVASLPMQLVCECLYSSGWTRSDIPVGMPGGNTRDSNVRRSRNAKTWGSSLVSNLSSPRILK